eukprot:761560-Hanusia_phi.AAC.5
MKNFAVKLTPRTVTEAAQLASDFPKFRGSMTSLAASVLKSLSARASQHTSTVVANLVKLRRASGGLGMMSDDEGSEGGLETMPRGAGYSNATSRRHGSEARSLAHPVRRRAAVG